MQKYTEILSILPVLHLPNVMSNLNSELQKLKKQKAPTPQMRET